MMGIYIKGMKMPESCLVCRLSYVDRFIQLKCAITERDVRFKDEYRADDCPLIELPPHGDLIDRDALMKGEGRYIISFGKEGIDVAEINRAPTIIPAEEPKEET